MSGELYATSTGAFLMPMLSVTNWATQPQWMHLCLLRLGLGEVLSGLTKWPVTAKRPTSHNAAIMDLLTLNALMPEMPALSVQVSNLN